MRKDVQLRSFKGQVRQYGDDCAVCPFCGKINDAPRPETHCHHLVRWNTLEHDTQLAGATFTDSPRQEKLTQEKASQEKAGEPNP